LAAVDRAPLTNLGTEPSGSLASGSGLEAGAGLVCTSHFPVGSLHRAAPPGSMMSLAPQGVLTFATSSSLRDLHLPPREMAAQRAPSGELFSSMEGPARDGTWLRLTYLPSMRMLRYEESAVPGAPLGGGARKLQLTLVSPAAWEDCAHSATLPAWQAAVQRVVEEAVAEERAAPLP
jgi:hypothetical protein